MKRVRCEDFEKVLICSDFHLTDKFDDEKCDLICKVFSKFDVIFLNGDFFDNFWNYEVVFDLYKDVFEILAKKKVFYVFGNHDPKSLKLMRFVRKFAFDWSDEFLLNVSGLERDFYITHGDRFVPMPSSFINKEQKNFFMKGLRVCVLGSKLISYPFVYRFMRFCDKFSDSVVGKIYFMGAKRENLKIKKKSLSEDKERIFICGHTHLREFDLESNFINCGVCSYDRIEFVSIIGGKIKLNVEYVNRKT